jgi:hypothetical protein
LRVKEDGSEDVIDERIRAAEGIPQCADPVRCSRECSLGKNWMRMFGQAKAA